MHFREFINLFDTTFLSTTFRASHISFSSTLHDMAVKYQLENGIHLLKSSKKLLWVKIHIIGPRFSKICIIRIICSKFSFWPKTIKVLFQSKLFEYIHQGRLVFLEIFFFGVKEAILFLQIFLVVTKYNKDTVGLQQGTRATPLGSMFK